jgi:murein DD-endopeptidase MepM/ murein hydrolase activator NlpD
MPGLQFVPALSITRSGLARSSHPQRAFVFVMEDTRTRQPSRGRAQAAIAGLRRGAFWHRQAASGAILDKRSRRLHTAHHAALSQGPYSTQEAGGPGRRNRPSPPPVLPFRPDRALLRTQILLTRLARRHRRGLVAGAVVLLGGFTLSAVAIAPLAPDAAQLPQRLVAEPIEPLGLESQLEALATLDLRLIRNATTRATDTPESLLARLGVSDESATRFLRHDPTARLLLAGRGGRMVAAHTDADGRLIELVARYPASRSEQMRTHFTRMTISPVAGQWLARVETAPLQASMRLASGTIQSNLFQATDAVGVPDVVALQVAEILSTDIDFHRELRRGDTFSIVYEALTADGEPVVWNEGAGRVLAVEFVNAGRVHQAMWFEPEGGRGGYFAADGTSKRRSFLASPMEFSRVTSRFAMRFHPILKTWRRHLGVDYGAPTGTPVRTVGDATVTFAGWQNGYGNTVVLNHGNDRETLYAHLSRIDVRRGQRVEQGQRIGAVGMTGWATGPHLHFEFRVRGRHQDPLRIARASEPVTLDASARGAFALVAERLQGKLEVAQTLAGAGPTIE